jgi:hypothetical protein
MREWPIDEDSGDMPTVPFDVPLFIDDPAVPLFMPDFDVSFDDGLRLGFASLLDPAAVPAPEPAVPADVCAKATPDIRVKHVAAIKSFFIGNSLVACKEPMRTGEGRSV